METRTSEILELHTSGKGIRISVALSGAVSTYEFADAAQVCSWASEDGDELGPVKKCLAEAIRLKTIDGLAKALPIRLIWNSYIELAPEP